MMEASEDHRDFQRSVSELSLTQLEESAKLSRNARYAFAQSETSAMANSEDFAPIEIDLNDSHDEGNVPVRHSLDHASEPSVTSSSRNIVRLFGHRRVASAATHMSHSSDRSFEGGGYAFHSPPAHSRSHDDEFAGLSHDTMDDGDGMEMLALSSEGEDTVSSPSASLSASPIQLEERCARRIEGLAHPSPRDKSNRQWAFGSGSSHASKSVSAMRQLPVSVDRHDSAGWSRPTASAPPNDGLRRNWSAKHLNVMDKQATQERLKHDIHRLREASRVTKREYERGAAVHASKPTPSGGSPALGFMDHDRERLEGGWQILDGEQSSNVSSTNKPSPVETTPIQCIQTEGYLRIAPDNKSGASFIKRWVVLDGSALMCYFTGERDVRLDAFDVRACHVMDARKETGRCYCFKLCVADGQRLYFLAPNRTAFEHWCSAIRHNAHHSGSVPSAIDSLNTSTSVRITSNQPTEANANNTQQNNEKDGTAGSGTASFRARSPVPPRRKRSRTRSLIKSGDDFPDLSSLAMEDLQEDTPESFSNQEIDALDKQLVKHLAKHPEDARLIISDHLSMVLRFEEHPLGCFLHEFSNKWKEEHYFTVYTVTSDEVLGDAVENVIQFQRDLAHEIVSHYHSLKAFPRVHATVSKAVESALFNDLFKYVFLMYKKLYQKEDLQLFEKQKQFITITPAHFGLPEEYWLLDCMAEEMPYSPAIRRMQDLASLTTASEKAAMFVDVGRIICKCVARHKDALNGGDLMNCNEEMTVGGDQLLPLFTYVIIKSRVTNLYSECRFVEDFLNSTLVDVDGAEYFTVTFRTSLSLMLCLDRDTLDFESLLKGGQDSDNSTSPGRSGETSKSEFGDPMNSQAAVPSIVVESADAEVYLSETSAAPGSERRKSINVYAGHEDDSMLIAMQHAAVLTTDEASEEEREQYEDSARTSSETTQREGKEPTTALTTSSELQDVDLNSSLASSDGASEKEKGFMTWALSLMGKGK